MSASKVKPDHTEGCGELAVQLAAAVAEFGPGLAAEVARLHRVAMALPPGAEGGEVTRIAVALREVDRGAL